MKIKNVALSSFLFLALLSCNQSKEGKIITIDALADIQSEKFAKQVDCFENVQYVALETTDSCRLPWKYDITLVENNNILITTSDECFLFDGKSGKLIRKIGKSGIEPSDFIFATGAIYNDLNKCVYFYKEDDARVRYSLEGEYLGRFDFKPEGTISSVSYLDSNTFCASFENKSGMNAARILVFDGKGDAVKLFTNHHQEDGRYMVSEFGGFYHFNNATYYKEILNDTVFELTKENLIPHFIISLPDHTKASVVSVAETQNYILYVASVKRSYYYSIYDKKSGQTATVLSPLNGGTGYIQTGNDLPINISCVSVTGYVAGDILAKDMLAFLKNNQLENKYGSFNRLTEKDNPVIVIAKLK